MKILFVIPISDERFNSTPDIGQGYLAALARQSGHSVAYLDCLVEPCSYLDFRRRLEAFRPDIVGIKVFSCDVPSAAEMLRIVQETLPGAVTVIGGPHPSCESPENLFEQFPGLDYAFAGEAEPGFQAFLSQLEQTGRAGPGIPGLLYRADDRITANHRAFADDLDALPMPAWEILRPDRYRCGYSFMTTKLPAAPMAVTRGCPFHCTFCGSHLITGRRVRRRNVDHVIDEIRYLQKRFHVRTIDIVDENFALDASFVGRFCESLLSHGIRIDWDCPYGIRIERLSPDLVRLMERSGCFGFSIGIESGSQRILDSVKKQLSLETVREKVHMIKAVSGITLQGYFMLGFPSETRADIEATIRLACSLPLDFVVFSPLRVTEGTEIYQEITERFKAPPDLYYQGFGRRHCLKGYADPSEREMAGLYRKAYLKFYGRTRVALNVLRRVRTPAQLKTIFNGILRSIAVKR
ncbi:B12-binding domain-containing radical SAM protein [Desulfatiglans anilini]|uniref:B12-binding domain-containing radical SAM protein n=1 Tax=Desulfatiglans anilini TaxID=90728 RepID=UPI00041E6394|nr:radical SAM protein [Desulfatiglans anilini]